MKTPVRTRRDGVEWPAAAALEILDLEECLIEYRK